MIEQEFIDQTPIYIYSNSIPIYINVFKFIKMTSRSEMKPNALVANVSKINTCNNENTSYFHYSRDIFIIISNNRIPRITVIPIAERNL